MSPLYQEVLGLASLMLSPSNAETGMKGTSAGLNPTVLIKADTSSFNSLQQCSRIFWWRIFGEQGR